MKTTLIVFDSLRANLMDPYYPHSYRFTNHWAINGISGPSLMNIVLSTTQTDSPSNIIHPQLRVPINHARFYPEGARSICKEFTDSCFITQHPIFSEIDEYQRLADQYHFMALEYKERRKRLDDCRLTHMVEKGLTFLEESSDDAMLLLWVLETHSRARSLYFADSEDPIMASIEYSVRTIEPLIEASDLVVLTSDHGEIRKPGTENMWHHPIASTRTKQPTQFHIPLIILGVSQGEHPGETSTLDIAPTILSLNGKWIPDRYEGKAISVSMKKGEKQ